MAELRWWLLDTSDAMRTSADGVRFDIWQGSGPSASRVMACAVVGDHYGPYRAFDTVFEAMAWAEEHYEAVVTERLYEDEER